MMAILFLIKKLSNCDCFDDYTFVKNIFNWCIFIVHGDRFHKDIFLYDRSRTLALITLCPLNQFLPILLLFFCHINKRFYVSLQTLGSAITEQVMFVSLDLDCFV